MNSCILLIPTFLFLYFIVVLPCSYVLHGMRYDDYKLDLCQLHNTSISPEGSLYEFDSNFSIKNCSRQIELCCNHKQYWLDYIKTDNISCFYNNKCDIIPEIIIDRTYTLLQVSSFIAGAFLAIFIIYYFEQKKQNRKNQYISLNETSNSKGSN